jgi:adenine deaminase
MSLTEKIEAARGEREVDLVLTDCFLVNVLSGRVHPAEVAISDGIVVGIDKGYAAKRTISLGGRFVAPGFIDAHIHIESSMLAVPEFSRAVVPRGTTTVVTDCHEIANVLGSKGISYMIDSAASVPLDVFVMLPPCVPATPLETSGAVLEARDLEQMKTLRGVLGLGELMNFPGTIYRDPGVMAKLEAFAGMPVDGHAPGLTGKDLAAYVAAGPSSDHECTTPQEAEEKLQKGMYLFLRQGTSAKNLLDLIPVINAGNSWRCCLCADDRHAGDLITEGHVDSIIRLAVSAGMSPVTAVQMATINSARRFGIPGLGAVAPGYRADVVVLDDLEQFQAYMVLKGGREVASSDGLNVEVPGAPEAPSSFKVADLGEDSLRLEGGGRVRVIGLVPDQLVTESQVEDLAVERGCPVPDVARDILKLAVVERHRGTGNIGVSFVRGFGLGSGALASSVAHDSHNIVAVGCTDDDVLAAVRAVIDMGGGQVAVSAGEVRASLPLPIAGLMSPLPAAQVAAQVESLNEAARGFGCVLTDPFMAMSFLALPVIPSLKLTDRGLVDVEAFDFVSPFAD